MGFGYRKGKALERISGVNLLELLAMEIQKPDGFEKLFMGRDMRLPIGN